MKANKKIKIVLVTLIVVGVVLACFLTPAKVHGSRITVSFAGITNRAGIPLAALAIQNPTAAAVKVMDHYYIETPDTSTYASTNYIIGDGRRLSTGTNIVVGAGQTGLLLIPVPTAVSRCRVNLLFTRPSLQTKLAEYLQQPHDTWVSYVPGWIRGVYIATTASCEFSADSR
ncbi:MAG TPA: hypothetical protein VEC99_09745 [Clostridia bacterium]|nr:hypothetical protein [Clostridia bacterium]